MNHAPTNSLPRRIRSRVGRVSLAMVGLTLPLLCTACYNNSSSDTTGADNTNATFTNPPPSTADKRKGMDTTPDPAAGTSATTDTDATRATNAQGDAAHPLTATDQSGDPGDVKITQSIRKALVGDNQLSTSAKNVTIVTQGGVVTVRGQVANDEERQRIATEAAKVSGVVQVNNQTQVSGTANPNDTKNP